MLKTLRRKFTGFIKEDASLKLIFSYLLILTALLFGALLIYNPQGRQSLLFFQQGRDMLADFLNLLVYVHDKNPYFNNYFSCSVKQSLPFVYLLFYPFSAPLVLEGISNVRQLWLIPAAVMSAIFVTTASTLLLFLNLEKLNTLKKYTHLFLFALLCSGIMLFSLERGNIIILSAACMAVFIVNYKSQTRTGRALAVISLSLMSVLKIVPVLMGFLWLFDKRYKDLLIAAGLTLFLALAPFFLCEGGFAINFAKALQNTTDSQIYMAISQMLPRFGLQHSALVMFSGLPISLYMWNTIALTVNIFALGLLIFTLFKIPKIKEEWQRLCLMVLIIIFLPTQSLFYCGLYMLPVIAIFLNKKEFAGFDYFYALLFFIFLMPLQILPQNNWIINNLALIILWLTLLARNQTHKEEGVR